MKITKFEHACFTVEENGEAIVVDPGNWTTDFVSPDNVVAVVITHEHQDHLDKKLVQAIADINPDVIIVAHDSITSQLSEFKTQPVIANEGIKIGNFELEFCGGDHAMIVKDMPIIRNLGVMINERLYYPGDSFAVPERDVEILALPVAAPWMKYSEEAEFVATVKPKKIFPTHDAILSQAGKDLADMMASRAADQVGAEYKRIDHSPLET